MKTNAAKELLALVDAWSYSGALAAVRDESDPSARPLWTAQYRAVRLLAGVEAFIASGDDADEYQEFVEQLRVFVFGSTGGWHNTGFVLDPRDRMLLKLLSELMDHSPFAVALDDADMNTAKNALEEALHVIERQEGALEERLEHVARLIRRCLELIEDDAPDLLQIKLLSVEAAGEAVGIPAEALPDEDRKRFTNALRTVITLFAAPAAAAAAGNIASASAIGLLGM